MLVKTEMTANMEATGSLCRSYEKRHGVAMATSKKRVRRLWDAYAFSGFRPLPAVRGVFGDPKGRVVNLTRRSKKLSVAAVGACSLVGTTVECAGFTICRAAIRGLPGVRGAPDQVSKLRQSEARELPMSITAKRIWALLGFPSS